MAAISNPATITTLQKVLREVLLDRVREQLNNQVLFLNVFQRDTETIRRVGRDLQALMAIRTKHNQSIGNRGAGGALPAHGHASYDQITVTLGRVYGQIGFDRAILINPLKGSASVLADLLDSEMESLVRTMKVDMSRQVQGDGSGALCQITSAGATGTSFVVDDSRYLEPGMVIDSYDEKWTGGTQKLDSVTISDVNYATHTVTIPSSTWAQNDYVFREDNRGLEMNGLQAAVDDGTVVSTYQGQDRSTSSLFKANLVSGGAAALSINMLIQAYNRAPVIAGEEPNFIVSDYDAQRYYATRLEASRRHVNTLELKAGFTGLQFAAGGKTIGWFADRYIPSGYIYFLATKHFAFFEAGPPDWIDEDGAILNRISGYDQMEATLCHYWQLGCDRCNCQTRLYNFADPTA